MHTSSHGLVSKHCPSMREARALRRKADSGLGQGKTSLSLEQISCVKHVRKANCSLGLFLKRHLRKHTGLYIFATKTLSRLRMLITCFFLTNALTYRAIPRMCWARAVAQISCGCGRCCTSVSLGSPLLQPPPPPHAPSQTRQQLSASCTQMFSHGETSLQTREDETRAGR